MPSSRLPKHRPPIHPGEILLEDFIRPHGITQQQVARSIGVPYQRLNEVVRGQRRVTPSMALRLGKYFRTSVEFWLGLQQRVDLYEALAKERVELERIEPLRT